MKSGRSRGVTIFGILLIVSSLYAMTALLDFEHYKYLFCPLPEGIILLRFFISWTLRISGLICGIGILFLENTARRLALFLFLFTILTVPWKHPYFGFQNHTAYLDRLFRDTGLSSLEIMGAKMPTFSSLSNISATLARILDSLFAAIFIYYFTRPKVKAQFNVEAVPREEAGLLEDFLSEKRARMADSLIPHNLREGRILDIGCGTMPFFLLNTEFKYKYGIEISNRKCILKENITLEKLNLEDLGRLPFEDNFFDVVTMLAVFEHINPDKLPGLLIEIKRVIKPGGRFIITTPCPWSEKLLRLMAKLWLVDPQRIQEHKISYGKNSIANYFQGAGFERERLRFGYFELFLNSWAYAEK